VKFVTGPRKERIEGEEGETSIGKSGRADGKYSC